MDYEKKYKEALERAKEIKEKIMYSHLSTESCKAVSEYIDTIIPELAESEGERILRVISEAVITFFSDYANDFEDEDRDAALAYLEKQKEQDWNKKPCLTCQEYEKGHKQGYTEGRTAGYNKAMKEVEQQEQRPAEWSEKEIIYWNTIKDYFFGIPLDDKLKSALDWFKSFPERFNLQPKQEWSEEDKEKIVTISEIIEHCITIPYSGGTLTLNKEYKKELLCFIRTLRPSWKPSEEDLMMLEHIIEQYETGNKNSKVMGYLPRVEELDFLKKVFAIWKSDD